MKWQPTFGCLQKDALQVLGNATGSAWKVPAEALYEAITQQGWRLRWGPLPEGKNAVCDFWNQTLSVSSTFAPEQSARSRQRMQNWILAGELGRLRYHAQLDRNADLEQVAVDYAVAFLLPLHLLREHPGLRSLPPYPPTWDSQEQRRRMARVCDHFGVPKRCLEAALQRYGFLEDGLPVNLERPG